MEDRYKITYILGAGASAKALPTFRRINAATDYTNELRNLAQNLETNNSINNSSLRDKICNELLWLADKGDNFGTVDTFAKYCYDIRNSDLQRVKSIIDLFFNIKLLIEKKEDPRYRIFLSKIVENKWYFPDNIKILNWNYDFQMQIAAERYQREAFNEENFGFTYSPSLIAYFPTIGINIPVKKFSMIHLNGIAGFYYDQQKAYNLSSLLDRNIDINQLFENHYEKQNNHILFTFAFEKGDEANYRLVDRIKLAKETINKTDILVIIGYSFPIDNVEIDKILLAEMVKSGLRKIIFQNNSEIENGDFLRNEFGIVSPITHKTNCDEFYIPREFRMTKE